LSDESFVTNVIKTENGEIFSKESNKPCEWVVEENFKFNLRKYKEKVFHWLKENPNVIQPKSKYIEALNTIDEVFKEDLSISRSIERVEWGIKVPNFPNQIIYVWLDALLNYYTVGKKENVWPPEFQVLGKDILKFHTLLWPAFLFALELELPRNIVIHSHWTGFELLINDQ
jgi:methionyl-tRNA synthetase